MVFILNHNYSALILTFTIRIVSEFQWIGRCIEQSCTERSCTLMYTYLMYRIFKVQNFFALLMSQRINGYTVYYIVVKRMHIINISLYLLLSLRYSYWLSVNSMHESYAWIGLTFTIILKEQLKEQLRVIMVWSYSVASFDHKCWVRANAKSKNIL
jgi:hypothetical protein